MQRAEAVEVPAVPGGVGFEVAARGADGGVLDEGAGHEGGGEAGAAGAEDPVVILAGGKRLVERTDLVPGFAADGEVEAADGAARVGLGGAVGEEVVEGGE